MSLQNRLRIATNIWREASRDPFPKIPAGPPEQQVEQFELAVVEMLSGKAKPENTRDLADLSWSMVEDRPDDDPVRQRVVRLHENLAELERNRQPPAGPAG
jgi:hypothetical protein